MTRERRRGESRPREEPREEEAEPEKIERESREMRAKALSVAAIRKSIAKERDDDVREESSEASPMKPKDRGKLAARRKESKKARNRVGEDR